MHLNVSLTTNLLGRPGKIPPLRDVFSRHFFRPFQEALDWCKVQPPSTYNNTLLTPVPGKTTGKSPGLNMLTSETTSLFAGGKLVLTIAGEQPPKQQGTGQSKPAGDAAVPGKPGMPAGASEKQTQQQSPNGNKTGVATPKPRVIAPMGEAQIAFLHFIATGSLPVSESRWTLATLQQKLHERLEQEHHFYGAPSGEDAFCLKLLALLLENKNALPRLLMQVGDTLLEDLYAHTMENGIVNRWIGWLSDLPGLDTRTLRWKTLLLSLSYTGGRMSLENYPKVEKGIVLYLLREMQPPQLFRWVPQLTTARIEKLLGVLEIPYTADIDLTGTLQSLRDQASHLAPPEAKTEPVAKYAFPAPDTYVDNAGLILLSPFLPHLFHELGWMDGINFTHESLHERAVLLTQYLVHPKESVPEYELRLNKLLCGYPGASPLPLSLDDETPRERTKAMQLLQAVLKQWTVNGQAVNPTIQDLRESFLQRRGKLVKRENDWLLHVEQKAFDVVLNSLTWNTRMIQLPWMNEILWVEWV